MRLRVFGAIGAAVGLIAGSAGAQPIQVMVNGQRVSFPYGQPTEINGRVMVPLRGVLERLGADQIAWRPAQREVTVAGPERDIQLWIGNRRALVNGERVALDVPPLVIQGTTMVPLRFVSENLGARVDWLDSTQTAYIETPNERVAGYRARYRSGRAADQGEPAVEESYERLPPRRQPVDRETEPSLSYVTALFPRQGSRADDPRTEIFARFRPGAPIDYNTVRLSVNGRDVTRDTEITSEGVRYLPFGDLPRGRNDVRLSFRDRNGLLTTQEWYFSAP